MEIADPKVNHMAQAFNPDICAIIFEILPLEDAILKMTLLNKNFFRTYQTLKSYHGLWRSKIMQEFLQKDVLNSKKYKSPKEQQKLIDIWVDLREKPEDTNLDLLKRGLALQKEFRNLIHGIFTEVIKVQKNISQNAAS